MVNPEQWPSPDALEHVRRFAGSSASIDSVVRLKGGQHADTWRVDTTSPAVTLVVRQFPAGDSAGTSEVRALRALDGLEGLAPMLMGSDLGERWSACQTTLISWLDGQPDITPDDPGSWATQLGHALARVHAVPDDRRSALPSVFDGERETREHLTGPIAAWVEANWSQMTAAPEVLTHGDYWSGNVVWRNGALAGIVDWSGARCGPRGYDVGWCRLDLYLLFDERLADVFLAAYEDAAGQQVTDLSLWDAWSLARSHDNVESWDANYRPLGRGDLDKDELRRRHARWTTRVMQQT